MLDLIEENCYKNLENEIDNKFNNDDIKTLEKEIKKLNPIFLNLNMKRFNIISINIKKYIYKKIYIKKYIYLYIFKIIN